MLRTAGGEEFAVVAAAVVAVTGAGRSAGAAAVDGEAFAVVEAETRMQDGFVGALLR